MQNTALLIDDNVASYQLIEKILQPLEIEVIHASNGETGFQLAYEEKPTVIIVNTRLRGVDGYTVAESLKNDEVLGHIPIIILTATILNREKVRLIENFDGYITMPFNPDDLRACVTQFLEATP
jgi:CheY-like chemotaxis protein